MKCFLFLRNSVLCIWLSNEGIKHQFYLSLNYWKLNFFLANKGNLLLKLKPVRNVVLSFLKKFSFHNFSSMYILLNKYFCYNIFKKTDFYFDGLPWIPLHSVCIWYEDSFTQMKRWNAHKVTLRAVLEMLFVCLYPHWDIMRVSVCVLKENAHLCHTFIHKYDRALWVNGHQIA